jgi:hypothetical protein
MIELVDFYGIHEYTYSMDTGRLPVGKTRYTPHSLAYHLNIATISADESCKIRNLGYKSEDE